MLMQRVMAGNSRAYDQRFGPYEVFDLTTGDLRGLNRGVELSVSGGAYSTVVDSSGSTVPATPPRFPFSSTVETNQILWNEDMLNGAWGGSVSAAISTETFKGAPFWTLAKTSAITSEPKLQSGIRAVVAGESFAASVALLAGTATSVSIGIYGSTGWGVDADATESILSGPGSLTKAGALWIITGLSATVPTVLAMRRVFAAASTFVGLYIYPGTTASTTIGHSIKLANPVGDFQVALATLNSIKRIKTGGSAASLPRQRLGLLVERQSQNKVSYSQADVGFVAGGTTPPTITSNATYLGRACTKIDFPSGATGGYHGSRAARTGNTYSVNVLNPSSVTAHVALSRPLTGSESIEFHPTGASGGVLFTLNASNSRDYLKDFKRVSVQGITIVVTGNNFTCYQANGALTAPLTVYVCMEQAEDSVAASSYIPTTGSMPTRSAEVIGTTNLPLVGLSASVGAVFAEFYVPDVPALNSNAAIGLHSGANTSLFVTTSAVLAAWDGTGQLSTSGTLTPGAFCRAAYTWSGVNQKVCRDGGSVASNAVRAPNIDGFYLAGSGGGNISLRAPLVRAMTFNRFLSNAEMQALTSLNY